MARKKRDPIWSDVVDDNGDRVKWEHVSTSPVDDPDPLADEDHPPARTLSDHRAVLAKKDAANERRRAARAAKKGETK